MHTLTLLPPTEMSHWGEAFSRAHINSRLLVAWEMLKCIHLWGLFLSAALNSEFDLAAALRRPFGNAEVTVLNNG